jgi:hypothetical protein
MKTQKMVCESTGKLEETLLERVQARMAPPAKSPQKLVRSPVVLPAELAPASSTFARPPIL